MAYYPLSQIKTDLYTNGGEYIIRTTKENYIGYYWKTSQSKYFTGRTPKDLPITELIKIPESEDNLIYTVNDVEFPPIYANSDVIKQLDIIENGTYFNLTSARDPQSKIMLPSFSPNPPKDQDYRNGKFTRYFCKKINEFIYIEIDKSTYDLLIKKDPQILHQLYISFNIPWVLTGKKEDVYKTNKSLTELTMFEKKLFTFDKYLNENYIKYYKEDF